MPHGQAFVFELELPYLQIKNSLEVKNAMIPHHPEVQRLMKKGYDTSC